MRDNMKNNATENSDIAISVEGLSKSFGKTRALDGATLSVKRGEIFGILGPDGAGKTTMMRIIAGLMPYEAGSVKVLSRDLAGGPGDLCDHIAYMPQRFGLYEDLSVAENIYFYSDLYNMKRGPELDGRIDELLNFCRMAPFKRRFAGKLSGGMKQKLALTCALIHTPVLLLLDEPTNGVDPVSRREFWKILQNMLATGVTIFVSTTNLDEAERCNRIAFLNNGKITAVGTPKKLKSDSAKKMWKLETSDKFAAVEILKSVEGVVSSYIMGSAVHIFTLREAPEDVLRTAITGSLKAKGLEVGKFESITANLEDIFIEQIGS